MKKEILSLFLFAAMALTLAGCGGHTDTPAAADSTPAPTATPNMTDILSASATNAAGANRTPPASDTNTANASQPAQQTVSGAVQEAYEKALACVGLPVEELYAAVGQPTGTPTYGPSCLQVDAEDGMLPYDGFSVWTVRSSTAETVHEVYLNE